MYLIKKSLIMILKKMMKKSKTPSIEELFILANQFKVRLLACSTSCAVMDIAREDMIDEVSDIVGATTFLAEAKDAKINLFI